MIKLSRRRQKKLIPNDAVKAAFFAREDISVLSDQEKEEQWKIAFVNINKFRNTLTRLDAFVMD